MARLFTAIRLPAEVIHYAHQIQSQLDESQSFKGRFVESINMHITLTFIGHVKPGEVELIRSALRQVHENSFELRSAHPGTFGKGHNIRLIHLPLHGVIEPLKAAIDEKLRSLLDPARNPLEKRKYAPHLTLARVKQVSDFEKLAICLADVPEPPQSFTVDQFELIQSQLSDEGPHYSVLERYPAKA